MNTANTMNTKPRRSGALFTLLIIVLGFVMAVPFFWMILSSFKSEAELLITPPRIFPVAVRFDNYAQVIYDMSFLLFYRNTIFITVLRTVAQTIFCSMSAFAFAKMRFPGRDAIFMVLLAVLMVPSQMIMVPNYMIMRELHTIDTLLGVALPGMFSAFGMFLLRQFYLSLPNELMEAGRIDGCSFFTIFSRIYFPLTKSAIMSLVIFTVMYSWNELLWPLIISSSDKTRVLSVGIALLQGQNHVYYSQIMAGSVMATIPVIVLFVTLQKYFIAGVASTGIKG